MKRNIMMLLVVLLSTILLIACEKPDELPPSASETGTSDTELVIDNEIVKLLEMTTFTDGHEPFSMRNAFDYVVVNDVLYLYTDGGELYHLNTATGYLTGLCDDPLCKHKIVTCPNVRYSINSAVAYNEKIYVAGQQIVVDNDNNMNQEEFIGYYDVVDAKYVVLDSWDIIWGYGTTGPIQIYEDEIYYLRKESDTINSLWKSSLSKKNSSVEVSSDNEEFIKGFIITDDVIYYTYTTSEAIYSVDMSFKNRKTVTTESVATYAFVNDALLGTNYGIYTTNKVEWDLEDYIPSDTPYKIFKIHLNETANTTDLVSHIQGATSLRIDHGIITATPDNPTFLGMEVINGKKKYYVNLNSGCLLIGNKSSDEFQTLDLSIGLGIDYSVSGIYYIDGEKCVVHFQGENKETGLEGIYIITNYTDPVNCTFHKLNYEP